MLKLQDQRNPDTPDSPHICAQGIFLRREKTGATSSPVIVEWTDRLRAVVRRLKEVKAKRKNGGGSSEARTSPLLFTGTNGSPMTYEALSAAWQRAVKRAKVPSVMLRDIRAKAATDKEDKEGIRAASALLDHKTEQQTAGYVRRKKARKTSAVS